MSTIVASPTGLAVLNRQQTGPLSSLPIRLSSQTLKSASRGDIAKLSNSALQFQQTQQLLGLPASSTSSIPSTASPTAGANSQLQQIEALFKSFYTQPNNSSINLLG